MRKKFREIYLICYANLSQTKTWEKKVTKKKKQEHKSYMLNIFFMLFSKL